MPFFVSLHFIKHLSFRSLVWYIHIPQIVREVRESLTYIDTLDPDTQLIVRSSYEDAVHISMGLCIFWAVCAFGSSLFIKEKLLPRRK
jgi:hypothetical protein